MSCSKSCIIVRIDCQNMNFVLINLIVNLKIYANYPIEN